MNGSGTGYQAGAMIGNVISKSIEQYQGEQIGKQIRAALDERDEIIDRLERTVEVRDLKVAELRGEVTRLGDHIDTQVDVVSATLAIRHALEEQLRRFDPGNPLLIDRDLRGRVGAAGTMAAGPTGKYDAAREAGSNFPIPTVPFNPDPKTARGMTWGEVVEKAQAAERAVRIAMEDLDQEKKASTLYAGKIKAIHLDLADHSAQRSALRLIVREELPGHPFERDAELRSKISNAGRVALELGTTVAGRWDDVQKAGEAVIEPVVRQRLQDLADRQGDPPIEEWFFEERPGKAS